MKYKVLATAIAIAMIACPAFSENCRDIEKNTKKQTTEVHAADLKTDEDKTSVTSNDNTSEKNIGFDSLISINGNELQENDFHLCRIKLGDSIDHLMQLKGQANKINRNFLRNEYQWEGLIVTVNNEMPYAYSNRSDLTLKKQMDTKGVLSFYVNEKSSVTNRNISVGSIRENVIRAYGKPDDILWSRKEGQFYFFYSKGNKILLFIIKDDKVKSFEIAYKEALSGTYYSHFVNSKKSFSEKDFSLAGFKLFRTLPPDFQDIWEKKLTNPTEEVLYYSGYAVRTTGKGKFIQSVFLTDKKMITSRGLTIGDDIATAELLYGAPHKVEVDVSAGYPRTSYIYFSKDKQYILIIFISKQKVDGVILAQNPQIKDKK